jgi:hypothetical protein
MKKEKLIKMNKSELKSIIKTFIILIIISIPFWIFYKTENEIYGLIIVIVICLLHYKLSQKFIYIFIEPRLYLSLLVPLFMFFFNII